MSTKTVINVTYKSNYKIKEKGKWIEKSSQWEETVKSEADARLRALALNWLIIKLEKGDIK